MRFLLLVEGKTEYKAIGEFVARWLNQRLTQSVGVHAANLKGTGRFDSKLRPKVEHYLEQDRRGEIIAIIGLRDLYGVEFPADRSTVAERYNWGVERQQQTVGDARFRMFFAVHETEAWLLSQPAVFPPRVKERFQNTWTQRPEQVDFNDPPAKRLNGIYLRELNRAYAKPVDGRNLFRKLDPDEAYAKCPHLKRMLDTMLDLARKALKEN